MILTKRLATIRLAKLEECDDTRLRVRRAKLQFNIFIIIIISRESICRGLSTQYSMCKLVFTRSSFVDE